MIVSISLSTLIITFLVIIINLSADELDKWNIIEYIFAVIFGWVAVVYMLMSYGKYIFKSERGSK